MSMTRSSMLLGAIATSAVAQTKPEKQVETYRVFGCDADTGKRAFKAVGHYEHCAFVNCAVAPGNASFNGCIFDNCDLVFDESGSALLLDCFMSETTRMRPQ